MDKGSAPFKKYQAFSAPAVSLPKRAKNIAAVVHTASVSATGSAKNTAKAAFLKMPSRGRSRMSGMSRITLRSSARKIATFACPSATKLCWHAIWMPKMPLAAI